MNFSQILLMAGVFVSLSLTADTGSDHFVECFRSCNEAFIADSLEKGQHRPEDDAFGRYLLEKILQEKLASSQTACSPEEFTLMGDAFCYFASNEICNFGYDPRPIYMPPFSTAHLESASSELFNLIGDRILSEQCQDAFHWHHSPGYQPKPDEPISRLW